MWYIAMAALADYTDGLEAKGLPGGSAEGGVMQGLYFRVIGAGTGEVVEGRGSWGREWRVEVWEKWLLQAVYLLSVSSHPSTISLHYS